VTTDAIETLVQKVQALPDPIARQTALDLVQAVMDLHAAGLDRMLELLSSDETSGAPIDALVSDNLVSGLLLLHDLHPLDLETRVGRALERPEFHSRGSSVELLSAGNGIVRVHIDGGHALRGAVEAAIVEAAPDAVDVQIEGGPPAAAGFVPLTALMAG
jgi:hypothetical protein